MLKSAPGEYLGSNHFRIEEKMNAKVGDRRQESLTNRKEACVAGVELAR